MRLSPYQRQIIKQAAAELAGPSACVHLFGSRVDDQQRGGDIDLLVELPDSPADDGEAGERRFTLSIKLGARLERALGGRKVDVIVATPDTPADPVLRAARATGMLL